MRRVRGAASMLAIVPLLSGCGLFGGDDDEKDVRSIEPGQCFLVPAEVTEQVSDLEEVSCDEPHDRESFAVIAYVPPDADTDGDVFPGDDALMSFADGRCGDVFGDYTGVPYLDSDLYFTYLLPSPRSWEDEDRSVVCFVIDSGAKMSDSVKDSRR